MNNSEKRDLAVVLAIAFLASLAWCLAKGREIQGDDAVIGLMALKISRGEEFPIFFWGAHYSGPIASYLAAPLHWLFEPSPIVLHSVIIPIHIFYSAGMYFLARTWLGQRESMIAGIFAALPAQLFPYSALGGFAESMAFVPWIFLLCLGESKASKTRSLRFLCGGFLGGFALWMFPLAFAPVLACFICQYKTYGGKAVKFSLAGCLLGSLPTIYYNLSQPGATVLRLLARPSAMDRQAVIQMVNSQGIPSFLIHVLEKWAEGSYQAFMNIPGFTISLLGVGPGATVWSNISGFIAFFALLFGLWSLFRYRAKSISRALLWTVIATYCFLVLFGLNRYRYLIPVLLVVPFGLALSIHRLSIFTSVRFCYVLVATILLLNILANFRDIKPRYPDYQRLAQFLESKSLTRGYASYTTAYPLVYLTKERLIYTPAFHEPEYDRNKRYTDLVARAETLAYIFDDDRGAHSLIEEFKESGVTFGKSRWGNLWIIHGLIPKLISNRAILN